MKRSESTLRSRSSYFPKLVEKKEGVITEIEIGKAVAKQLRPLDRSARQGPTEEGDIDDDDGLDRQSDSFFRSLDDDADDAVDEDDEIDEPKGQL